MTKKHKRKHRRAHTRKRVHINKRDMDLLRHTARFRGTMQEALHAKYYPGMGRDAVKSTLRRLCGPAKNPPGGYTRYLCPEPLDHQRVYYRLTVRATKLLGVSKDLARPLGPQARIRWYAKLWFLCIEPSASRVPLNLREFPDKFNVGGQRLPRAQFYIEERPDGETRLGFIVVDHGRHRLRVFRNAANAMRRFLARGWLDEFIASRSFDLTILTLNETTQRGIQLGLGDYLRRVLAVDLNRFPTHSGESLPFSTQTFVVPGLIDVIPGAPSMRG